MLNSINKLIPDFLRHLSLFQYILSFKRHSLLPLPRTTDVIIPFIISIFNLIFSWKNPPLIFCELNFPIYSTCNDRSVSFHFICTRLYSSNYTRTYAYSFMLIFRSRMYNGSLITSNLLLAVVFSRAHLAYIEVNLLETRLRMIEIFVIRIRISFYLYINYTDVARPISIQKFEVECTMTS